MLKNFLTLGTSAVVALTGMTGAASAQPAPGASSSGGITDVVITARKRAESLQKDRNKKAG